VIYRPLFVDDLQKDLDQVQAIFDQDYSQRFKPGAEDEDRDPTRKPLSPERSLGSVIKLLTPTSSYTDEFNAWLASISPRILALVFLIKRFYRTTAPSGATTGGNTCRWMRWTAHPHTN